MIASTYPRFRGDGGAGRSIHSIAEALAARGHEVHVLAPYHSRVEPLSGPVCRHHFRYIWPDSLAVMGYSETLRNDQRLHPLAYVLIVPFILFGALALLRLHRRYRFDVLHAHWVIPNGLIAAIVARLQRLPLVISLHGSDVFLALRRTAFGMVARAVFGRARAVTACSPDLHSGALRLGAPPERTFPIVWGADPYVFASADRPDELRQRWGLGPQDLVVLSLGRLVRKKGLDDLLRAAPAVLAQVPQARFVIAGDGPEHDRLFELAGAVGVRDRVVFPGSVKWDEVPRYLHACDVFVAPSVRDEAGNADGLPATVLEAMAAGKTVVASRVGGIPWAVRDGETGCLVDERQPDQLAAALVGLLADPARRLNCGRAARRRVEAELNWGRVADDFVAMYRGERRAAYAG